MTALATMPVSLASVTWSALGEVCFVAALFVGSRLMPGTTEYGATRPEGGPVVYRMNGLALLVLTLAAAGLVEIGGPGLAPLTRHVWSLFIAASLLATLGSAVLFLVGRRMRPARPADFFYGVERDPSLFGVDLKMFSYRPSLIGLALMNLSCASAQYAATGSLSLAMSLYVIFTLLYIINYFHFEYGMLHTWDIIEEKFGWMLIWGDYALVPFFYAMPAFYVATRAEPLGYLEAAGLVVAYALGLWVFRGANQQKHRFKRNPSARIWGRPATSLGGKLLVSGFWGIGRKLNYTGELTMYCAWCALAGTASPVPYLLPAFLAGLLTHRALRDDRRCRAKYGPLWTEYCARARFRMFPVVETLAARLLTRRSEILR